MDIWTISGIVIFFAGALSLWLCRKTQTKWLLPLLVVSMLLNLFSTVYRIQRQEEAREAVWHPNAVIWGQAPIRVFWDRAELLVYNEAITTAMQMVNDRVATYRSGCAVLVPTYVRSDANITIRGYDGNKCASGVAIEDDNPDAAASAWYCGVFVDIQIRRVDEIRLALRIFLHELGHGVGLAHDETGAMSPTVVTPTSNDPPEYLLLSNKDAKAIGARYCGKPAGAP